MVMNMAAKSGSKPASVKKHDHKPVRKDKETGKKLPAKVIDNRRPA
jgi:hypothetical protein